MFIDSSKVEIYSWTTKRNPTKCFPRNYTIIALTIILIPVSGVRLDNLLQECQNPHWKRSFPDLDYAVFGYDILKGYPLATGHDPGFTHPIFVTDYTSEKQTSDCRYSVPAGLIVVPDVSCETSFSSKVVRNRLEMSKSLEASANIEGGLKITFRRKFRTLGIL